MQTAFDYGNPGPDYHSGYGQVNIQAAVDLISRQAVRQDSIAAGEADVYSFIVPDSNNPVKVSLVWDDFEATFNASMALINDLDLELVCPPGQVFRPWVLNPASPAAPAVRGLDKRNNQEQVTVPSPETGTWMVRVLTAALPQSPHTPRKRPQPKGIGDRSRM